MDPYHRTAAKELSDDRGGKGSAGAACGAAGPVYGKTGDAGGRPENGEYGAEQKNQGAHPMREFIPGSGRSDWPSVERNYLSRGKMQHPCGG